MIKRLMPKKFTHNDNFVEYKLKENNSSLREKQQRYSGCHFNRQSFVTLTSNGELPVENTVKTSVFP